MNEQTSLLKTIDLDKLVKNDFIIPNYQRAFRWQEEEINFLLDDIYEAFIGNKKICLQPLVVKKSHNNSYEVIDGQQRLTTIYLIIYYLNNEIFKKAKDLYSIQYKSRKINLRDILQNNENNSIDFVLIKNGYKSISNWFNIKHEDNSDIESQLYSALVKCVFFIWYEIIEDYDDGVIALQEQFDSIKLFLRLNIGKIKLTDSELIKAWLINKINNEESDIEIQNNKKIIIMKEWDDIEQRLRELDFWYFLNTQCEPQYFANRIVFIFETLLKIKYEEGRYLLFYSFSKKFESVKSSDIWLNVKNIMLTFIDWYSDRELYHYIGLLTSMGCSIQKIIKKYDSSKTQNEFKKTLIEEIKNKLNINSLDFDADQYLQDMNYLEKPDLIFNFLLAFNVFYILKIGNNYNRFPFASFYKKDWDIEHVHSQTGEELLQKNDMLQWIESNKEIVNHINNSGNIIDFSNIENKDEIQLKEIYNKILDIAGEQYNKQNLNSLDFNEHSISNLVLLDAQTNRSYKNSVFFIKRKRILNNESNGYYVPLCTKNIFLKVYSNEIKEPYRWTIKDMEGYYKELKTFLETIGK